MTALLVTATPKPSFRKAVPAASSAPLTARSSTATADLGFMSHSLPTSAMLYSSRNRRTKKLRALPTAVLGTTRLAVQMKPSPDFIPWMVHEPTCFGPMVGCACCADTAEGNARVKPKRAAPTRRLRFCVASFWYMG